MSAVPAPPGSGGASGVTLEQLQTEASTPAEVQAVLEAALAAITPPVLEGEVRMFAGDLPDGWTQVQGPAYQSLVGTVIVTPRGWETLQALGGPQSLQNDYSAVSHDGKVFLYACSFQVFEGVIGCYDPTSQTWEALAPAPAFTGSAALASLGDGRLLLVGSKTAGEDWLPVSSGACYLFDTATNTWSTAASMPAARSVPSVINLTNGNVLVYSYDELGFEQTSILEYDRAGNVWTEKASTFAFIRGKGCVLPSGNVLMLSFEFSERKYCVYDPVADVMVQSVSDLPFESIADYYGGACVSTPTGALFYTMNGVHAYDEQTNTWAGQLPVISIPGMLARNCAVLPGIGIFAADPAQGHYLVEESIPRPIRYAKKD